MAIISKLIWIRRNTFLTAAVRSDDDYVEWENQEQEHSTMFYPNWPIWRYPKKYEVRNVTDCDFCEKEFNKHNDFSFGVFSVGCMCPYNITMGYELMLCKESAHNIFRLLMCRDVNMHALKGVVFDFACGLDQYMLNREPVEFEYLRLLVDGAHWQVDIRIIQCCHLEENLYQGQKKLKRPDRSGRGGHIGCSDGFNYNLYKPFLPYKQPNSQVSSLHLIFVLNGFVLLQGREQMHAKLDKLCPSLKQMDYSDYMHFLRVFFGFSNLKNKGII